MHRGAPCTAVHHHLCAPAPWCITVVGAPGCTLHRVHRMCEAPASRCFDVRLRQGAWCCTSCDPAVITWGPCLRGRGSLGRPRLSTPPRRASRCTASLRRRARARSSTPWTSSTVSQCEPPCPFVPTPRYVLTRCRRLATEPLASTHPMAGHDRDEAIANELNGLHVDIPWAGWGTSSCSTASRTR